MIVITDANELEHLPDGNRFIGELPQLINTQISFKGSNNMLVCRPDVRIENSVIEFNSSNAIVYLCENEHAYHLSITVNRSSVFYMGKNSYMNEALNVITSERKHCFIGESCLLSRDIWMRNADPHLVYNCSTGKRMNPSRSIFIGDHVWIGQAAMLLKGTQIDSGSIIGAMSLVAGKKIPHNESWGGNPCRKIADSVFWEPSCVHDWTEAQTAKSMNFSDFRPSVSADTYQFRYNRNTSIPYEELDKKFSSPNADAVIACLDQLADMNNHNRFAHHHPIAKKKRSWRRLF